MRPTRQEIFSTIGVAIFGLFQGLLGIPLRQILISSIGLQVVVLIVAYGYRLYTSRIRGALRKGTLAGLRQVYTVSTYQIRGRSVEFRASQRKRLHDDLEKTSAGFSEFRLLLASGFDYVGTTKHGVGLGPLGRAFEAIKGPVRLSVLLIEPGSTTASDRAREFDAESRDLNWYSEGTRAVIEQLVLWSEQHPDWTVEVHLYNEPPIWQLVILGEEELWLLCSVKGMPSELSPAYRFDLSSKYGLGWGLLAVWDRRIGEATGPIDLSDDRWKPTVRPRDLRRLPK